MNSVGKAALSVTMAAILAATPPVAHASAPQYLGQWQVSHRAVFDGTLIGGLSGISYDQERDLYYTISDDKADHGNVRFYSVRLNVSDSGIDGGHFVSKQDLLDESGRPFRPNDMSVHPPVLAPDAEAIAFDSAREQLYWTSEGFVADGDDTGPAGLLQPWIRIAGLDGTYRGEFVMPPGSALSADKTSGPRRNGVLEGLTLTPDGRHLFAAMEQSLYQDGPTADEQTAGQIRITKFDVESRTAVAQYAYQVERAAPRTGRNGVPDILALSESSLLVIERAANLPHAVAVALYRADLGHATDVLGLSSLNEASVTPMAKSLVVDLNALDELKALDNVEGITQGPVLPDGRRSVVLVSDDNFQPFEVTQFLAFAL
ncbi:phytase [Mycolicibacterium acapulense]|uniref:esterase-like activity of phytase family protein n=1 Tax=Mycobacterium lehmannii TaxID=2048550 RepID=UPI0007470804|nr:esterase-like activity of phytase family protein [Mycobacterium lehmannii]KUH97822.1 phytase [Mycolicibacterium acapulense]KUH98471.1 phytase [Mycolicibacterium acapulense]KUI18492.1 phytase [Mycolicibacterium acapulense]